MKDEVLSRSQNFFVKGDSLGLFLVGKHSSSSSAVGHYDELMESQHGLCSPCYASNSFNRPQERFL